MALADLTGKIKLFVKQHFSTLKQVVFGLVILILAFLGGGSGPILAFCLLFRFIPPLSDKADKRNRLIDFGLACAAAVLCASLCQLSWAPRFLLEGNTLSSEAGESFGLLHSLSRPHWEGWKGDYYPLPALLAWPFSYAGNPHDCWYAAAIASMGAIGAGLFLWGRALAGIAAGFTAVLLVGAFPDLVLMVRSVTGHPEIIGIWTLGAGLAAYALRYPGAGTCALAGIATAAVFASDSRGLLPGLLLLPVVLVAAFRCASFPQRMLGLLTLALPSLLLWFAYYQLPLELSSLEQTAEVSVESSYTRLGHIPPAHSRARSQGYVWGKSSPHTLPRTARALVQTARTLNPAIKSARIQREAVQQYLEPLLFPVGALALAWLLLGGGLPSWGQWTDPAAWLRWLDWRARLMLLPVGSGLLFLSYAAIFDYNVFTSALAVPAMVMLALGGIRALAGPRAPTWCYPLIALALLYMIPGPMNLAAEWRTPHSSPRELRQCLAAAKADGPFAYVPHHLEACVRYQKMPLKKTIAWPY